MLGPQCLKASLGLTDPLHDGSRDGSWQEASTSCFVGLSKGCSQHGFIPSEGQKENEHLFHLRHFWKGPISAYSHPGGSGFNIGSEGQVQRDRSGRALSLVIHFSKGNRRDGGRDGRGLRRQVAALPLPSLLPSFPGLCSSHDLQPTVAGF